MREKISYVYFSMFFKLIATIMGIYSVQAHGNESYCYSSISNAYHKFSTKTPYREVLESPGIGTTQYATEGCEAEKVWLLQRHGMRYPGDDDIEEMNTRLPQIMSEANLDESVRKGLMCESDRDELLAWTPKMVVTDDKRLSTEGRTELKEIARRFKQRFSLLFSQSYDSNFYEIRHTDSNRTRDSARAFAESLFGSWEAIDFVSLPEEDDWLLKYYDNCKKYIKEVDEQPILERDLFELGKEMLRVIREIENVLQLTLDSLSLEDIFVIYDACRYEYGIYNSAPWCSLFPTNITQVLEYNEDLEYYYEDAYGGHDISWIQACTLINDVYSLFMSDNKVSIKLRFGHSANVNNLLAFLGLYKDTEDLRADTYDVMGGRKWRTSVHTPMAANIAFVKYNCNFHNADENVTFKVFVNEEEIMLPNCESSPCNVDKAWFQSQTCDIQEVCKVSNTKVDAELPNEGFRWSANWIYEYVAIMIVYNVRWLDV